MHKKHQYSKVIAGTMNWGIWGSNLTTIQMAEMIAVCLDNQITSFDHADIYGGHTTEAAFGKAFKETDIPRENIQLITKCGIKYPSENRNYPLKHYDYSVEHILFSVENSLRNLQTDYIDLLLLHRPSPLMQPEIIAEAISKLKKEGKILDFGLSNFTNSQTDLIQSKIKVDFNQIQFSISNSEAMTDGSLDYMRLHKITPMAWNPLGTIFRGESEHSTRVKLVLSQLAIKYHVTTDVILLAWIQKHPANIIPVTGTSDKYKIHNIAKSWRIQLANEDWFALWVAAMGHKVP